ncbi:MAG: hypothetical protein HY332_02935, partial [Chloroflexi bacterium]|nr:hypothetical protein [Chloroflexota bacterium]
MWRQLLVRLLQGVLVGLTIGGATGFALQMAAWPDHPLADMTHIMGWVQNVQRAGPERVYEGTYPASYLIYPPGMAYVYQASLAFAERVPPSGYTGDEWLRYCVKLAPIAGHAALVLALFGIVAAAAGFWRGWLAATFYAWNPAALFDAAYWGQTDSLIALGLVLALAALFAFPGWWPLRAGGRWRLWPQLSPLLSGAIVGIVLAAAGLTKPQAWIFLPLLLWIAWRRLGPLGLSSLAAAAGAAAWLIVQPWVRAGPERVGEMFSVFANLNQVMPSVSANGHNLWWLRIPGLAVSVLDWEPLGGIGAWESPHPMTFATAGRLGFGLFALLPLLRLAGPLSLRLAFACAGYTATAYFMTITQVHENHLFNAVPFMAAAAALDGWLALPFVVVSLSSFLNLALHDFLIGETMAATLSAWLPWLGWHGPLDWQTGNALLNVAGFALFTIVLLRRPPAGAQSAASLRRRARLVLLGGVALAGSALGGLLLVLRNEAAAKRLWTRIAESALRAGPVEAHLGRATPAEQLLARAAVEYANLLQTLAGIAAIVGAAAVLAGVWWLLCAYWARYHGDDRR